LTEADHPGNRLFAFDNSDLVLLSVRLGCPCWKRLRADSEEKREPVSDFNTAVVDSLKALDPNGRLEKRTFTVGLVNDWPSP